MNLSAEDIKALKKVAALFPEGKPVKQKTFNSAVKEYKRSILMNHLKRLKKSNMTIYLASYSDVNTVEWFENFSPADQCLIVILALLFLAALVRLVWWAFGYLFKDPSGDDYITIRNHFKKLNK